MTARTLVASAARTTSGNSGPIPASGRGDVHVEQLHLLLNVTAVAGTSPTLNVTLEWSHDDGASFHAANPPDSFAEKTGVGSEILPVDVKGDTYRLVWTIAGTGPSFTFGVTEDAR